MDALLGIAVEVFLLLVEEGLGLKSISLLLLELLDLDPVLDVGLTSLEVEKLSGTLSLFFFFLLLSHLKLFIALFPELSKVLLFLLLSSFLGLLPLDLELTASLDSSLHFSLTLLLLLIKSVGTIFSLSDLPVEHFLLVVLQSSEILDLAIDHALPGLLLILEALVLTLFLHVLKLFTLLSEGLDFLLLFNLFQTLSFLHPHELVVGLSEVGAHLSDLLLAHDFTLLFTLQVFLDLSLDELTLEHLFLQRLNEVKLEILELLANVFSIRLLQLVLLLELGAHLFIVLVHLLTLNLFPMRVDVAIDCLFALVLNLLSLLLVGNIAHHHLALKSLNHVLAFSHCLVGSLDLLTAELILIVLLLSVKTSALKLVNSKNNGYTIMKNSVIGLFIRSVEMLTQATYLSVFEFLNASLLTLQPLSLHRVRPVADASLGSLLKLLPLIVPQSLVRVSLGLNNLSANAVEFVHGDDGGTNLLLGVARAHGVNATRVG